VLTVMCTVKLCFRQLFALVIFFIVHICVLSLSLVSAITLDE